MPISADSRCELCEKTFLELSKEQNAMFTPTRSGHHNTCADCVAKGKEAGLGFDQIMRLTKEAFEKSIACYERYLREVEEHKVITVDFKNKVRKK